MSALQTMESIKHEGAKELLKRIIYVHMFTYVHNNLSFYILNGLISHQAAKGIQD